MQKHWTIVAPSEFEHERRTLDFVRAGLPDHDPYRAWANFEFQTPDGALYEVDLLVLGKGGFWLVEVKSRPGRLEGDFGTWTWTTPDGRRVTDDNPIHLANKKSKALAGVLRPHVSRGVRLPFLEPLVFLSNPDLDFRLTGSAASHVCLTDRPADDPRGPRDGVLAALTARAVPSATGWSGGRRPATGGRTRSAATCSGWRVARRPTGRRRGRRSPRSPTGWRSAASGSTRCSCPTG